MKFETIKTETHWLLVDKTQIVSQNDDKNDNFIYVEEIHHYCKIIAAFPKIGELPLLPLCSTTL